MDEAVVEAVLQDWTTAPVSEGLKATLGFLQKITLHPEQVDASDVARVRSAGISDAAIEEALYVCFIFNVIDRLADAFDYEIPPEETTRKIGKLLLKRGYGLASIPG